MARVRTRSAAGRAWRPSRLRTVTLAVASGFAAAGAPAVAPVPSDWEEHPPSAASSSPSCAILPAKPSRAAAATRASGSPRPAVTAAATAPSTSGAAVSSTLSRRSSPSRSAASSAERTALPRSIRTSTPSSDHTSSIAASTRVASVPRAPGSSSPPAAPMRTFGPAICAASSATPSASFALWLTMTRPTTATPGRPRPPDPLRPPARPRLPSAPPPRSRAAARSSWLPDPGARRCARRGSWRGPCARPAASSRACPSAAASAAARVASPAVAPPAAASRSAAAAGSRASTMVLSPGSALPRICTPATPAVSAAAHSSAVSWGLSPAAFPSSRKNVPYRGPAAPPTVETSVIPTVLNSGPSGAPAAVSPPGPPASSLAATACMPRSMLMPWSASPMAESSSVSSSRRAATSAANARSQAVAAAASTTAAPAAVPPSPPATLTRPTAGRACPRARPTAASARRRA